VGLFGPNKQQQLAARHAQLATQPIMPVANWRQHMKGRIPEYHEMTAAALQISGRDSASVDRDAMARRANVGVQAVLKGLCEKLTSLDWTEIEIVLNRRDFSGALLSDYLSTAGAAGVVANDKLSELMDGLPALLAEEVQKGTFDTNTGEPEHLIRVIGSGGVTAPVAGPIVRLPNPGLPEDDPLQICFKMFDAMGMVLISFGPVPLEHLTQTLLAGAPVFRDTTANPAVGGLISGRDIMWIAFDGPQGSAVAVFSVAAGDSDVEFLQNQILKPMSALPAPLAWAIGTAGANVPQPVAEVLATAHSVPLWELSAFSDQRPPEELQMPAYLRTELAHAGWEPISNAGFKTDVSTGPNRTLPVYFACHNEQSYVLMTPLDRDELIPPEVRTRSFGQYELGSFSDMAVLQRLYLAGPSLPDAHALRADAESLARYTHAQFIQPSGPPAESRPPAPHTSDGVRLTKGGNVSLTGQASELAAVNVGLGWDTRATTGAAFDLDASALATGSDKRVLSDSYFVFFNNSRSPEGAIVHRGDNRDGAGDSDDEVIHVDLACTPDRITSIFFVASIYEANKRGQAFGQVRNAYIRVVNCADNAELARYDLTEDAATETAMVFGELYRRGAEWKFRAVGQGYASGLAGIAQDYGVNIES